ncbi:MAG: hypothetical protein FD138_3099 [Planctomycetota bacterium]|nr:MAG: hypothetical protein FD138_3099 [Planctomycetota bacterium]
MIAQFALRLICGMSLMWALMPRRQVTSGFFRIQNLVVMGLGVLATLAAGMEARPLFTNRQLADLGWLPVLMSVTVGLIAALGVLGFVGSVLWTLERRIGAERVGFGVCLISTALIVSPLCLPSVTIYIHDTAVSIGPPETSSRFMNALTAVSEFAGAAVLGSTVVGMLLGHWYLTTPTMSIDPLKRLNKLLGIAGVLRLLVSMTVVGLLSAGMLDTSDMTVRLATVPRAWFSLRWLAGIIGPLVVSLMVWRILKYRNTQAATGVLFVGVILAFIGDMTAALLLRETGLPL